MCIPWGCHHHDPFLQSDTGVSIRSWLSWASLSQTIDHHFRNIILNSFWESGELPKWTSTHNKFHWIHSENQTRQCKSLIQLRAGPPTAQLANIYLSIYFSGFLYPPIVGCGDSLRHDSTRNWYLRRYQTLPITCHHCESLWIIYASSSWVCNKHSTYFPYQREVPKPTN